ncbi:hypothetical protein GOP47_0010698 [Adiantum capillus-veneris]|uniref:VOC domain-containing protein n=1 Tax=Adiantum capillus-veneris TaxID=13818 RepID=A0A9D4ZI18_ADICA|nr:hypothetical protein GOP47_0010698 [Adiantum capillus-veneris]
MASPGSRPAFSYTVLYVEDVKRSLDFYSKAFGFKIRRLDDSHKWGELDSGPTTIAFTPIEQRETAITGGVHIPTKGEHRPNIELSFSFDDFDAAFKHAIECGAEEVAKPEGKVWGQKAGYVRDLDGVVIRLGSHVHEPHQ